MPVSSREVYTPERILSTLSSDIQGMNVGIAAQFFVPDLFAIIFVNRIPHSQ